VVTVKILRISCNDQNENVSLPVKAGQIWFAVMSASKLNNQSFRAESQSNGLKQRTRKLLLPDISKMKFIVF
jgi:hypothetical protein